MMMLSDRGLVFRIGELAGMERAVRVELLQHLAELERRGLHLELGFPSLFAYCTGALRFSKASAFRHAHAAGLLGRFPRIGPMLVEGSLCLVSLCLLREVLSEEVLDQAAGKTVEEVRELVATLQPQASRPDSIRPVSGSTVEVRFTASAGFMVELEQARALLSHKLPRAGLGDLLHECLRVTIKSIVKSKGGSKGRYIPAAVRRTVWERDQGRCTFHGSAGPCGSTHLPELHHVMRHADGGAATAENLTVYCRKHNQHVEERRLIK